MTEQQQAGQESAQDTQAQEAQTTEDASQELQGAQDQDTQESQGTEESQDAEAQEASSVEELPKWARDEIRNLRRENARRRTEGQQRQDSEATELTSVTEERDTLRNENDTLRRQVRRQHFIEAIGLPNARAAWALAQDIGIEVEWDENDRPQRLTDVRKRLREEDSALFGNGSADGGPKGTPGPGYQGPGGPDRIAWAYEQNSKS